MRQGSAFLWAFAGALCVGFSKGFEAMGDAAFNDADRSGALAFHLLGLGLLIAAIACGWKFFRASTASGSAKRDVQPDISTFGEPAHGAQEFDADEALANYLAKREAGLTKPISPPPPGGGFGRRGL